jgi:hypothetical protein
MEIKVPEVGESVTEATVVALLKKSGDHVTKGEEIVELETDKVNSVITAPESGILELKVTLEQKVKPTETLPDTVKKVWREAGFTGFFVAWRVRYMLYLTQALFTVDIIERFENKLRGKVKSKE